MHEVEIFRFQRGGAFWYHCEFSQRAAAQVEDAGKHGIARLETSHLAADCYHSARQIAAQGGRQLKMQNRFEHAGRDHVVDRVQAHGMNLDQQFVRLRRGAG